MPIGLDVLRTPIGSELATREFTILDQVIPTPFPIGATDLRNPAWIPINDSLGGSFIQIRRGHGAMPARHDEGIYAEQDLTNDTRLIGRSAWNTDWTLSFRAAPYFSTQPRPGCLHQFRARHQDILPDLWLLGI